MKLSNLNLISIPTYQPSVIQMHIQNKDFQPYAGIPYEHTPAIFQNQNLYIALKAEIKTGDWYLFLMDNGTPDLMLCRDDEEADRCNNHPTISKISYKIILTTDPDLDIDMIPAKFLKEYCNGFGMDFVDVENEGEHITVTEHISVELKNNYSRNEVIGLLKDYRNCVMTVKQNDIDYLDNFVKENLK